MPYIDIPHAMYVGPPIHRIHIREQLFISFIYVFHIELEGTWSQFSQLRVHTFESKLFAFLSKVDKQDATAGQP